MQCGLGDHFTKYRPLTLHRNQFHELCALLFYKTHLIQNAPFYIMAEQPDGFVIHQHPFYPRFDAWDNEEYYRPFARLSRIPFEQLYFGDSFRTYLDDEQGNPKPWPA